MTYKRSFVTIATATLVLVALFAVCVSSASVSAAGVSRANVQPSSRVVGNGVGIAGAPAVCSQSLNSLDIFVRGTDNALWWRHWDGTGTGWGMWQPLGGSLTSDPAAVSVGAGKIQVSVRGSLGDLQSMSTTDGGKTWTPLSSFGGQLLPGTGPAVYGWNITYSYWDGQKQVTVTNQQLGWLVTGTDHTLWWMWTDGTKTSNWQSLGGYLTSSPAATAIGAQPQNNGVFQGGIIDVAVRGGDNALWLREYNVQRTSTDFGWLPWISLGGQIAPGTAPAMALASYQGPNQLDVFVKGTDGALWHQRTPSGYNLWSGWQSLGGRLTSSPAATWEPGQYPGGTFLDVFVVGTDHALWWKWYFNGQTYATWSSWTGPIYGPS
jgi:hypothetical protein